MRIKSSLRQLLISADARIFLEQMGLQPEPEIAEGVDTGRVRFSQNSDGSFVLFIAGKTVQVSFTES